ncbi:ExbD/TolR family protein [Arhodomonas sp. SL1]|uniref:ExbD/TolR family protein n=1 Tax=Arhodomonas sp. SL1 TaxID=3425691 RepID=UPI003F881D51
MSPRRQHEPEINLTPLIDVVFLMLIFFMVSTTFIQQTRLDVTLPSASAVAPEAEPDALHLTIDAQGNMFLDERRLRNGRRETIERALAEALAGRDPDAAHLIIDADARARHQMVIRALDAAGRAGVSRVGMAAAAESAQ